MTERKKKTVGVTDGDEIKLDIRNRGTSGRRFVLKITHDPDIEIEVTWEPKDERRVDETA